MNCPVVVTVRRRTLRSLVGYYEGSRMESDHAESPKRLKHVNDKTSDKRTPLSPQAVNERSTSSTTMMRHMGGKKGVSRECAHVKQERFGMFEDIHEDRTTIERHNILEQTIDYARHTLRA